MEDELKNLFRYWARLFISATSLDRDVSADRLKNILVSQFLTVIIPFTILTAYRLLIIIFPEFIHVFAVLLLMIFIPMFVIGIWHLHKLKTRLRRKQNTSE